MTPAWTGVRNHWQFYRWKEAGGGARSTQARLVNYSFIGSVEPAIDDREGVAQLLFGDAERRVGVEGVPANQGVEALLAEEAAQGGHLVGGAVEGGHGLASLAAAYQLDDAEESDRAHRSYRRMLRLQFGAESRHDGAHFFCVVDQSIFFVDANRGQRGGASHGMAVVSQASVKDFVLKMLCDVMTHAHGSEREIAGSQSLGHRNQVRDNLPVIDGEPRAGAAESGHDFVRDHQDAVLVAQFADTF